MKKVQYRSKHPELALPSFADLPAGAITRTSVSDWTADLIMPLGAAETVALKAALGTGTLAYGPAFPGNPFAQALRARSAALTTLGERKAGVTAQALDQVIARAASCSGLSQEEISALPRLHPGTAMVQSVIFVPQGQLTWLIAHFMSMPTPTYGIRINAVLPALSEGITPLLPIQLRDAPQRLEITDFTYECLKPALGALGS
ncbi:hypothetical protein [Streptomyces sp. NPDC007020]|uniref:hypothetical protein n=1 Tax=Streptomyces sp. NPDC007020 TaxID=3154585 RepID=UPI0033C9750B